MFDLVLLCVQRRSPAGHWWMGNPNSSRHGWDSSWYSRSREKGCLSKVSCVKSVWWPILLRQSDDIDRLARMVIVSLWPWCWLQGWQYWTRLWHTGPSLLVKGSLWQTCPWPPPLCRPSGAEIYWVHFQKFLICCSNNWRIAKVCSWWGVEVSASASCSMVEYGPSSGEHNSVCGFFNKKEMREVFHLTCDDCVLC